ncbi:PTS sugar transporter subunit IIB [Vallitaleaceae bacterium 9-2]
MYKVLVACGAGIGSSMIMKRNVKQIFDELGVPCEITHESIGTAKSKVNQFDLVFTLSSMVTNFSAADHPEKIIGLKNVVAKEEARKAIETFLGGQ